MHTAFIIPSRVEANPNENTFLKIRADVFTQPNEVNTGSTGKIQEDPVLFHSNELDLPSEEQLWKRKQ